MISLPLFKQDFKSNLILTIVVLLIMCMMCTVVTFAMSMMDTAHENSEVSETTEDFYTYLAALATGNMMTGSQMTWEDFRDSEDRTSYDMLFTMMNQQMKPEKELSSEDFARVISVMETSDISAETYVQQFEYAFALAQSKGVFSGDELTIQGMMTATLEVMGVSSDLVENMSQMDTTSMLNRMYFTVIGLLPIFLLIVLYSNSLLASQVDNGSMAYILSTPTRRSSVAITQALFMIIAPLLVIGIVCCVKLAVNTRFMENTNLKATMMLYLGMYLLVQAVAGICYLGSCLFNQSSKAMAFGGGLTVWFFLASMLGMFGTEDLVNMGVGVEKLGVFNKLTLIGLYDIEAIGAVGTDAAGDDFIWKLALLAGIAIVCYVAGAIRFTKKDLPL